jgi:hypothetical protein
LLDQGRFSKPRDHFGAARRRFVMSFKFHDVMVTGPLGQMLSKPLYFPFPKFTQKILSLLRAYRKPSAKAG